MTAVELLAALRRLAEAMIALRPHVTFTADQNAALEAACELIVCMEVSK